MKQLWAIGILASAISLRAVPIIVISPNNINTASGYSISSNGNYLLSDDVNPTAVTSGNKAILITSSHVVLDLNNKTIFGSGGGGIGITNAGNVTIRNGKIFNSLDSGISGTNVTSVTIENIISSSNKQMGINLSGGAQCFIRVCTTEANTSTGISVFTKDTQVLNCTSENNNSGLTINGENVRITGGQYNRNAASGITVVTSTQVVIEQLQANDNGGQAGISLQSGADFLVNNCLTQHNTGTGVAVLSSVAFGVVRNSMALHNSVDGFSNNSGNSTFAGNFAYGNVSNNYGGTGPIGFMTLSNGGQFPLGSTSDVTANNISIV